MKKPPPLSPNQHQRIEGFCAHRPLLGPETVHIDITNTCNLDCITCWNYAPGLASPKNAAWKKQRMASAIFSRVLSEVAECGVERIILSGAGEPFTHPGIYDFIAAVKAKGLVLTVITNGTLCDFQRLKELGVDQLLINTSSASAATYTTYHPNQPPETFENLIEGVISLAGAVAVNLVQVINALNADELTAMVELAHQAHARASFKLGDTPPGTECCRLDIDRRKTLLEHDIPAAIARAKALGVKHNLAAFAAQLAGSHPLHAPLPCFAGYLYSRVYVDGRVFFCCEHIEVGNVEKADFGTLWLAPAYNAIRQSLHEGLVFPGCARCGKHDMNFVANKQLAMLMNEVAE
ncbi:MAG: Radical domain protein [Proteobacteria bacterium]|nr:Radical domain protein [Pseudomonadota bacterium]